ncbi:MAG: hypothetical protein M1812_004901 [Candelaria pacifica]|nr:MAG: hypothetical protein M1812_004901 [Candelaria pacifica]
MDGDRGHFVRPQDASDLSIINKSRHDSVSPLSLHQTPTDSMPTWVREAQLGTQTRPSRASSMISTRTKTSILTAADDAAESFEVPIGLQRYKFGLDGSILSITNADADHPPPAFSSVAETSTPLQYPQLPVQGSPAATSLSASSNLERQRSESAPPQSSLSQEIADASGVSRNPSFTPGKESLSVQKRYASSNNIPTTEASLQPPSPGSPNPNLRRRNGVRLKLVTRISGGQKGIEISPLTPGSGYSSISASSQGTLSAGPRSTEAEPASPSESYIGRSGRGATGLFPVPDDLQDFRYAREAPSASLKKSVTKSLLAAPQEIRRKGLPHRSTKAESTFANQRFGKETSSVSDGSGIAATDEALLPPSAATKGPAEVDDEPIGTHPPPSMDHENDISIHYSRLIRSIDKHHRHELFMRDKEIDLTRSMIQKLAKDVLELKTELVWTKSHIGAIPESFEQPKSINEQSESNDFSFPPLKISHLQVMKKAMKRRADKLRHGLDEVRDLRKMSTSTTSGASNPPTSTHAPSTNQGRRPGKHHRNPQGSLHSSRETNHNLATGVPSLEQALPNPATTQWSIWTNQQTTWSEQQKARSNNTALTRTRFREAIDQAKNEVEETWETRWKERDRVYLERIRRMDAEAQRKVEKAVNERDEEWVKGWKRKNLLLLECLEGYQRELRDLKGRVEGRELECDGEGKDLQEGEGFDGLDGERGGLGAII